MSQTEYVRGSLAAQIETEVQTYLTGVVTISEDNSFSQAKLVRRIALFENHIYPTGKFDSAGNYKFWFDIQTQRVGSEVKNIDFDTKDIKVESDRKIDLLPTIITNLSLKRWLRENGQAEELNSGIEEGAAWGNVAWKKVRGSYERVDLKNFYVINQTVKSLNETPVIERHEFSQSDLRAMSQKWNYVPEVLKGCKSDSYSETAESIQTATTVPYYEIYERNGEVCLKDLKEYNGDRIEDGDDEKYVLAKVIGAGVKGSGSSSIDIKYVLFAKEISKMPYKEYHRGRYKGRWFREGIIELLFDCQVRANQIGNQLAQGLEWASKTFFYSNDLKLIQNVLSDLRNGDILKSSDIKQVPVVMTGFTELANEWNRILTLADAITNSLEIVQGITPASGTPLGTSQLVNQNSNKLYDFIREKIAIPFSEIFEDWIVPQLVSELKVKDIIKLMGDSDMMDELYKLVVDSWYIDNLIEIGPHTKEIADTLKTEKLDELKKRPQLLMVGLQQVFDDFKPSVSCVITGENSTLPTDLQNLAEFIGLEQDPIRRTALIEIAMRKKGIDVGSLPKTPPQPPQPVQSQGQGIPQGAVIPARKVAQATVA